MKKYFIIIFLFLAIAKSWCQVTQIRDTVLMGSNFRITVVDSDELTAEQHINAAIEEIRRIEYLISDWIPTTPLSQVNQNAGIKPVVVPTELIEVTQRAIKYSQMTQGAFDITFAAMDSIWKFDGSMEAIPSQESIAHAIRNIGYQNIQIDEEKSTLFLPKTGMKMGFGSIGKGYAAEKAKELLKKLGTNAAIVDASGDMAMYGTQISGDPWKIGIQNPVKTQKWADILAITSGAVTTSGDYQKYIYIGEKRYAHIINPKTGWPSSGLTSVTIVGPDAEIANVFSTAIMVLGAEEGKKLLKNYPHYAGLFITDNGKIIRTKNYKKVLKTLKK